MDFEQIKTLFVGDHHRFGNSMVELLNAWMRADSVGAQAVMERMSPEIRQQVRDFTRVVNEMVCDVHEEHPDEMFVRNVGWVKVLPENV